MARACARAKWNRPFTAARTKWTRRMLILSGLSAQSQHRVRVSAPMVLIALLCGCAIRHPDSGGPCGLQHSALSDSEC